MIEIIFSIVLISIIFIFAPSIKKNTLYDDRNFLINKIRETKSNANNINLYQNNAGVWKNYIDNEDYNSICINLNFKEDRIDNKIAQLDKDKSDLKYYLSDFTNINITNLNNTYNKLCFDSFGTPYNGNLNIENKLNNNVEITLENRGSQTKIIILKETGFLLF